MLINLRNIGSNFGEVSCQTVNVHLIADVDSPQVIGRSRRVCPVRLYYNTREFQVIQKKAAKISNLRFLP